MLVMMKMTATANRFFPIQN